MKKICLVFIFVLLLSSGSACGDGIHGSVMGSRLKCSSNLNGGHCEGSFKKLSGTYSEDMSMTRSGFFQVQVEVWASVEEGEIRVFMVDPEGNETSAIARDGQPIKIQGDVEANYESFRVYFEALDDEVWGVSYIVDYTYP